MKRYRADKRVRSAGIALILVLLLAAPAALASAAGQGAALPRAGPSASSAVLVQIRVRQVQVKISPDAQLRASGFSQSSDRAKGVARGSPLLRQKEETRIAKQQEARREAALEVVSRAMAPNVAAQASVVRLVRELGGRIESQGSGIGVVAARLERSKLGALEKSPVVLSVREVSPMIPMGAMNAATWNANGYYGQIPAGNDPAGVDVGVYDDGITTGHRAFRQRLAGDCGSCAGSGPSRIVTPSWQTNLSGSIHGNAIAATIGITDFARGTAGKGIAYGIDKLEDPWAAEGFAAYWLLDVPWRETFPPPTVNRSGSGDPVEIINYSRGRYEDQLPLGYDPGEAWHDAITSQLGVLWVVAAGNCGRANSFYDGCNGVGGVPHRVATPANTFNVLSVGGSSSCSGAPAQTCVWADSSAGPTWDGRKKPDLLAYPGGAASNPMDWDVNSNGQLDDYGNAGSGTSFSAPIVAGGAALLASTGVSWPAAQRAILVNSAAPVQGQTYWTPTSGWGSLDLDAAFMQRGFYKNGEVAARSDDAGANRARFFRLNGAAVGDRTTLTWDRRSTGFAMYQTGFAVGSYLNLTNFDLFQFDPATLLNTATGGVDANDSVDTNTTQSGFPGNNAPTDNPMPPSGNDGGDNIEQIRSTASGTQIVKVKAQTPIDGAASERFAVASSKAIDELAAPIPKVTITPAGAAARTGTGISVDVKIENPSADLALESAQLNLTAGAGGSALPASTNLGTLAPSTTTHRTITVEGTLEGETLVSAKVAGTRWSESFAAEASASFTFDDTPPALTLAPLSPYTSQASTTASWSSTDNFTATPTYDVETRSGAGAWTRVIDDGSATTYELTGDEGEAASLRVRARDALGNTSEWQERTTTFARTAPSITFGAAQSPARGQIRVPVSASSTTVALASATYSFDSCGCGAMQPLVASPTFANASRFATSAVLRVQATDILGRTAQRIETFSVGARWLEASLTIDSVKVKRRRATLRASTLSIYRGSATVTIVRTKKSGTRRIVRTITARNGNLHLTVNLKPGRYRASVEIPQAGDFLAQKRVKNFSVR
jgi:hypothetical protein